MVKRFIAGAGISALIASAGLMAQDMPPPSAMAGMHGEGGAPGTITRPHVEAAVAKHFAMLDADHDGAVTRAEFDAARASMWQRMQEHRARAFDRLDANKDGVLSRDEFDTPAPPPPGGPGGPGMGGGPPPAGAPGMKARMMGRRMGAMAMMMGPQWFDRADADHDGRLTLAEARTAALAMFDRVDANHDGTISPDERRAAMRMMMQQRGAGMRRDMPPPPPPQG